MTKSNAEVILTFFFAMPRKSLIRFLIPAVAALPLPSVYDRLIAAAADSNPDNRWGALKVVQTMALVPQVRRELLAHFVDDPDPLLAEDARRLAYSLSQAKDGDHTTG